MGPESKDEWSKFPYRSMSGSINCFRMLIPDMYITAAAWVNTQSTEVGPPRILKQWNTNFIIYAGDDSGRTKHWGIGFAKSDSTLLEKSVIEVCVFWYTQIKNRVFYQAQWSLDIIQIKTTIWCVITVIIRGWVSSDRRHNQWTRMNRNGTWRNWNQNFHPNQYTGRQRNNRTKQNVFNTSIYVASITQKTPYS